ncbi:hypothetical protein HK100_007544, partial [Physocladia obscura]
VKGGKKYFPANITLVKYATFLFGPLIEIYWISKLEDAEQVAELNAIRENDEQKFIVDIPMDDFIFFKWSKKHIFSA